MRQSTVRNSIGIMLTIIVCGIVANGAATATRDWTKNPAVVQFDTPEDIFAIGDPHGDLERPARALAADGNNRDKDTFFQRYGLLFLIDSGMSHGIEGSNSTGNALRIRNGNEAIVICADGTQKVRWDKEINSDRERSTARRSPEER